MIVKLASYDPVKWTLDFHQFLLSDFKWVFKVLFEDRETREIWKERSIELYDCICFEHMNALVLEELLVQLLNSGLCFDSLDLKKISILAKEKILKRTYLTWPKGKIYFYHELSVEGKKTNPENLRPVFKENWDFLFNYFELGYPRKGSYKTIFKEKNEESLLKAIYPLALLFKGILNFRDRAAIVKHIDLVYYQELISDDDYYDNLIIELDGEFQNFSKFKESKHWGKVIPSVLNLLHDHL